MQEPTSARYGAIKKAGARAFPLRRVAWVISPLLVACLVLLFFNALIPRLTRYYYWVQPNSTMGWAVQAQGVVLKQIVPGKKNVIVIGDSRISEGFSAVEANKLSGRPDINFVQSGIPGTTPRVWYYFLREIDPDHKLFSAVVLMTPRFDDNNDHGDLTNNAIDLTYLTPLTSFRDFPEIVRSFTGFHDRLHTLATLLMPLMVAREDLYDFAKNPKARITDAKTYHEHFFEWLLAYRAPITELPELSPAQLSSFDVAALKRSPVIENEIKSYVTSVIQNPPGVSPEHERAYRIEWYGKIADEYNRANVPTLIFQVPRGPYESYAHRHMDEDSGLITLARENKVTLLDARPFEQLEQPKMFQDALHVNGSGQLALTHALTPLVVQKIPAGN